MAEIDDATLAALEAQPDAEAVPRLIAAIRQLQRERDDLIHDIADAQGRTQMEHERAEAAETQLARLLDPDSELEEAATDGLLAAEDDAEAVRTALQAAAYVLYTGGEGADPDSDA